MQKKSNFEGWYLTAMALLLFVPKLGALAKTVKTVTSQTKYIDKYYQVDATGKTQLNIYLGDDRLVSLDNLGNFTFPIIDHLGSPTVLTNSQGQVVGSNDYQTFGRLATSSVAKDQYKFSGKELDPENNLEYFGQRYYSTQLGRFMSVDPLLTKNPNKFLTDPQELNSYAYAKNNPLKFIDPDGLLTKIYLEKNQKQGWFQPTYEHAFMAIDGIVYNWENNAGRKNMCTMGDFYGEDMEILPWTDFTRNHDKSGTAYQVYTLNTAANQEEAMQQFYLELAKANSQIQGNNRFLYDDLFYNGTRAVVDALKKGGVVNQKFDAGNFIAQPDKLQKQLDLKYKIYNLFDNFNLKQYYQDHAPSKIYSKIIDRQTIKPYDK